MSPTKKTEEDLSTSDESNKSKDSKNLEKAKLKRWLLEEVQNELLLLAVGSIAMLLSSVSNAMLPRFMGNLLDHKAGSSRESPKGQYFGSPTVSLLLVVFGGGSASFLRTTTLNRAEENIASRLRTQVFSALMTKKDIEWFQTERIGNNESSSSSGASESGSSSSEDTLHYEKTGMTPGAIGTILNSDVTDTAHTLTATTANLFRSTMSATFSTYNMLRLNPQLFLTSLCTVPLIGAAAMTMRKFLKRVTAQRKEQAVKAASFAEERITQIAMVKMSNRELDEVEEYKKMQDECTAIGRKESLANGAFMGFTFSATSSALFMVVHLGGRAVAAKRMSSGQLTSFATYSFLLGLAASGIVKGMGEMYQSMIGAQRVYKLVHGNPENEEEEEEDSAKKIGEKEKIDIDLVQSIALRNLTFGYKARPDTKILKNVSIELKRGSVVALCGKNGSGKTTVASLLAGLHKPQSGTISLLPDGVNYSDLDRSIKSQLVQMVPQGSPLLNMSILDNIKYSKPSATAEEVDKALKTANCDFISTLPGGVNFIVGLHGCKLSAGQRQRLALARALIADPVVLILDEASSALDHEGENALSDAVLACRGNDGSSQGHGLLLITHRPKSLEVADIVVVLRDGQVVETGSLSELKKNANSALCTLMPDLLKM